MKKLSMATTVAALLLGIGAFMHATPASALPPCSTCATWWQECEAGNQSACTSFANLCRACPEHAALSGTPPISGNNDSNAALLNSHRTVSAAK